MGTGATTPVPHEDVIRIVCFPTVAMIASRSRGHVSPLCTIARWSSCFSASLERCAPPSAPAPISHLRTSPPPAAGRHTRHTRHTTGCLRGKGVAVSQSSVDFRVVNEGAQTTWGGPHGRPRGREWLKEYRGGRGVRTRPDMPR
jgi:hypothetical protein